MGEPLAPKWANEEWCDYDDVAGEIIDGETYLPLTNVFGGPPGDTGIKWLDYDSENGHFIWSRNPANSFFMSPGTSYTYLMRWDNSNSDMSQLDKNKLCSPYETSDICTPEFSNEQHCLIGHRQKDKDNWKKPQSWCTDYKFSNHTDCVGSDHSRWGRSPRINGTRGPGFCSTVKHAYDHGKNQYVQFYLDGTQTWSGSAIPMNMPVDYSQGDDEPSVTGCYDGKDDSTSRCPTTMDILDKPGCGISTDDISKAYSSWISHNTAAACCSLTPDEISSVQEDGSLKYPQCRGSFNPSSSGTKCVPLMNKYCEENWNLCAQGDGSCLEPPGRTCDSYLAAGNAPSVQSSRETISNYINDDSRNPPDYISWKLKERADKTGIENPSSLYYKNNNCSSEPLPGAPTADPCSRDDGTDPFFVNTLSYLCNTPMTQMCVAPATGVCDSSLRYMCQQFDREDLNADPALLNICGCSLLQTGRTEPYPKPNESWKDLEGAPQTESPYYDSPSGDNCDPVCAASGIYQCSGPCTSMMCIIDDVTVNVINSSLDGSNPVTLSQLCNDCGERGCICYMGDITVRDTSDNIQAQIKETCDTCYSFTDNDLTTSRQIDCDTGYIIEPDGPKEPSDEPEEKPWYKRLVVIATLIIIGVLVLLGFGVGYYYRHKKVARPEVEVYDPTDAYYNFDFSDFDFSGY